MNTQIVDVSETASVKYSDLLKLVPFTQSLFQTNNFVINNEHTPHRQLRQTLLQYDQLCYTLLTNQNKMAQSDVEIEEKRNEIEMLKDSMQHETDRFALRSKELRIKKIDLEIQEIMIGQSQSQKLIDDALTEKANYEQQLARIVPTVQQLEATGVGFEQSEKIYWASRLTQAARLTMFNAKTGNQIDTEVLKSILQTDKDVRDAVLQELGMSPEVVSGSGLLLDHTFKDKFLLE